MAFLENKESSGKSREFLTASSTAINKGDALVFASGYLTPATASNTGVLSALPIVIANESVTTASGAHNKILWLIVDPTMEFIAPCDDATAQSQVGTSVKFKDAGTVDNGTTGGNIKILEILPWKKALVKFY